MPIQKVWVFYFALKSPHSASTCVNGTKKRVAFSHSQNLYSLAYSFFIIYNIPYPYVEATTTNSFYSNVKIVS